MHKMASMTVYRDDYGDPCGCQKCMRERSDPNYRRFMHVCPICGNKRCPHCADHRFQCTGSTGSNEPDQVGKPIPTVPQTLDPETKENL